MTVGRTMGPTQTNNNEMEQETKTSQVIESKDEMRREERTRYAISR